MNGSRSRSRGNVLLKRFTSATLSAAAGAALGYGWARLSLPAEVATARLLGMYASAGAVLGVLAVRLGAILASILKDALSRQR